MKQQYLRADTLLRANACLVAAQAALPLASVWGTGETASADGLRFSTPLRNTVAAPNSKYFGAGRGVTYYARFWQLNFAEVKRPEVQPEFQAACCNASCHTRVAEV